MGTQICGHDDKDNYKSLDLQEPGLLSGYIPFSFFAGLSGYIPIASLII